jgi:hypothetical protein
VYTTPDLRDLGGANAYLRSCASRSALDLLANKWVCLVVGALAPGPMRFGALRRLLDGITQKMLTKTLRDLERACRLQVLARSTGGKLRAVRPEVVRDTYRLLLADSAKYARAHFTALKRILDREEPDYSR